MYCLIQQLVCHVGAPCWGLGTCFIYPQGVWILPYWRFHGHYKPVLFFVLLHTIIFYVNKWLFCWLFYFVFHFLKPALWLQKVKRRVMQRCVGLKWLFLHLTNWVLISPLLFKMYNRAYRCKHGSYGISQAECCREEGKDNQIWGWSSFNRLMLFSNE